MRLISSDELKKIKYGQWQGDDGFNAIAIGVHFKKEELLKWIELNKIESPEDTIGKFEHSYMVYGNLPKEYLEDWGEDKHNGYWEIKNPQSYKRPVKITKYKVIYN